jgi:hypothetical protein
MQQLSPEFYAIVVAAVFIWAGLINGLGRIVHALERAEDSLIRINGALREAPWLMPHPDDAGDLFMVGDDNSYLRRRRSDG